MATPNIVIVATINAKNATANLTGTSRTEAVDVPADKVAKINTILVANIDGSNAADITIEVSVDNGSNYVKLANTISVPADATLSFLENPIYLDETDLLYFTASAANDLSYFVSYELLDDAQEVLQAMANGGIIGPVQEGAKCITLPEKTTTFTSSGTFTAQGTASVDYLVVAGGGGGGGFRAGGGGAGGYQASGYGPSPLRGSSVPVVGGTGYTITVGAGGAGGPSASCGSNGVVGNNSVFNYNCGSITGNGGGYGGNYGNPQGNPGGPGGSGGGGGGIEGAVSPPSGQGGSGNQGNPGGAGGGPGGSIGGGGGGRGSAGGNATSPVFGAPSVVAGDGGSGVANNITGSCVTYAGGGGGGARGSGPGACAGGAGGPGGGGHGGEPGPEPASGAAGTANTGGGGGGAESGTGGGQGGSGVIIIKEPEATTR